jgi:hypothetical protein
MALDDRIALTLYDRIFDVISGSDPAANLPSAFDTTTTRFVAVQRGMVLNPADYANPWTPGNPAGSIQAASEVASLVDTIPENDHLYSPTLQTVSDVYTKMVNLVHVTEPPPSEALQRQRDELKKVLFEKAVDDEGREIERPTKLADQEQKAFNDYQDAYMAYVAQFVSAQKDPALSQIWPIVGAQALQRPKRAFADWAVAGRDQVAAAKAQLATLNEAQVARAFADAQFRLKAFELVNALSETFLRTNIAPSDWAGADASHWPTYTFSQSTFDSSFSAEATSWGAAANVQAGLWSFGGGVDHADSRQSTSQDTTNIGVSFKWRVCPVYRKWMDGTLFRLANWAVPGIAGPMGISGSPGALMPLIPVAMVLVRDVAISADWSHQDSEHIDSAISSSASVGWGPFAVSGHYSHSSTSDRFSAKRSDQGFVIPDPQILGFVCLKVPSCPPL